MDTDSTFTGLPTDSDGVKYTLGPQLGEGGQGVTFRAERRTDKKVVVLKILQPNADAGQRDRFVKEANILESIRSERIVRIIARNTEATHPQPFIVLEYIQGVTLQELIEEADTNMKPIPRSRVFAWISGLLSALAECHGRDPLLIHRDVKPRNIMVDDRDGNSVIKLIDFGLARSGDRDRTKTTDLLGSYYYMPMEFFGGSPSTHVPASDVFSVAVVAFRLLIAGTGIVYNKDPWFQRISQNGPSALSELQLIQAVVPSTVVEVLKKALGRLPSSPDMDPTARYQDAAAMLKAWERAWPLEDQAGPSAELARLHWEYAELSLRLPDNHVQFTEHLGKLMGLLAKTELLVGDVERRGAEVRERLRNAIEAGADVRSVLSDSKKLPDILPVQQEYLKLVMEACGRLTDANLEEMLDDLHLAIIANDETFWRDAVKAVGFELSKAQRRKDKPPSNQSLEGLVEAWRQKLERLQNQLPSQQREVLGWHHSWCQRLGTWEQIFRAEVRDFNVFATLVARLSSEGADQVPTRLAEPDLRERIEFAVKRDAPEDMRAMFRKFIRMVYPDLTQDENEKKIREKLTVRLIAAYDARDMLAVKDACNDILSAGREGPELPELEQVRQALASLHTMLTSSYKILEERETMRANSLHAMWSEYRKQPGIDPIEVVKQALGVSEEKKS